MIWVSSGDGTPAPRGTLKRSGIESPQNRESLESGAEGTRKSSKSRRGVHPLDRQGETEKSLRSKGFLRSARNEATRTGLFEKCRRVRRFCKRRFPRFSKAAREMPALMSG